MPGPETPAPDLPAPPRHALAFAVASPYAWDVVESLRRHGTAVRCVDNHGGADPMLPGLTSLDELSAEQAGEPFVLGLAAATHRASAARAARAAGLDNPLTLHDPTAVVASTARFGHGVYANAASVVASQAEVGCFAHVNRSASVGHHDVLGFAASLGPGVVLAGHVEIGAAAFVGTGATVLPGVRVGRRAVVGAGAVVTKDVPDFTVVVGNPARPLKDLDPTDEEDTCPFC